MGGIPSPLRGVGQGGGVNRAFIPPLPPPWGGEGRGEGVNRAFTPPPPAPPRTGGREYSRGWFRNVLLTEERCDRPLLPGSANISHPPTALAYPLLGGRQDERSNYSRLYRL